VPSAQQPPVGLNTFFFFCLESCLLIFGKQTKSILSYKIMNEAAPAANGLPQGVAPITNGPPQGVAAASDIPANAAAQRKQKAAEERLEERRI
jgi:hypothetical protein